MHNQNDVELAFERSVGETLRDRYAQVLSERLPDELLRLVDAVERRAGERTAH
jgi:hypothetical protein